MKKLLPFIIIVIAVAVASVLLFNNENKQQESVIVEPLRVETQVLVAKDKTFAIHTQGIVRSTDQTQLMAEISGVIASISPRFQVGSFFHVDEVLFTLESLEYQAAVKQAKAVVAEKKAQLVQETAKAKQAKMQWKDVSNATDLALRKPFVAEAKALLQSAEAKLERAQQILRRTEIKAPYDGIVTEKTVGLGQYVNPGSTLGKIVSVGQSEIRLPLKDQLLGMLDYSELSPQHNQTGCQLSVELSFVYKGEQVSREAEVCRSEAVIDAESRVHYLVANILDPYLLYPKDLDAVETRKPLKIGTFVTAKLLSKQYDGVFEIPRELLRDNNQILMVEKSAGGEDEIHFKQINYFHADNKYIYVKEGLKAGDRISLTYIDMPIEGMAVAIEIETAVDQGSVN